MIPLEFSPPTHLETSSSMTVITVLFGLQMFLSKGQPPLLLCFKIQGTWYWSGAITKRCYGKALTTLHEAGVELYNWTRQNEEEVSYAYFFDDPSIISRVAIDNSGLFQQLLWNDGDRQWKELWLTPKYSRDNYGHCGAYSKCTPDNTNRFECTCLPGYEPKSPRAWYFRDGSEGCVRKPFGLSMCGNGEGFVKVARLKPPDTFVAALMDMSMSSSECEQACLRNCSCTAFVNYNISRKGFGCLSFYGELMDILDFTDDGFDLNVRVDAAEFGSLLRLLSFF
nr:g-type lectin s-receptor-like serine/threonine-protein kinase rks1 [Quercus suber]